ncbi:MAG: hypothetical protein R3C42_02800 [Parvularculaceae bacterium]|nr:hypothetical protein [Parvularculaceae bacterium]
MPAVSDADENIANPKSCMRRLNEFEDDGLSAGPAAKTNPISGARAWPSTAPDELTFRLRTLTAGKNVKIVNALSD